MSRLRYNGLATGSAGSLVGLSLGASLTNSATSVTFNAALTYQNGTAVPTITGSDHIPLSILDSTGAFVMEVVYLTAYTTAGTTGTILRGQEGFAGVAHSSADKIVHAPSVLDLSLALPLGSPDTPPSPANAKDDEGDGTSSVTWAAGPVAPTFDVNTTRAGHLTLSTSANSYCTQYQAVPGAYPYTFTAKMDASSLGIATTNFAGIALTVAGATTSSGLCVVGSVSNATPGMMFNPTNHTTGGWGTSVSGPSTSIFLSMWAPVYLRMRVNSATSVDMWSSGDGIHWRVLQTAFNPGFTPGLMGLMVNGQGSALEAQFDWFRVT